ncbi:uncharacterized protein BCR38DRAFT_414090 [Pseudomassariella vexata]|uniref:Developmental regulatory protein wetA n=1 Tax=Pseudomassariella vexata TaxID=1141098 RepID=A0A1Y2DDP9_9PEZI|nr:uncharacterized protein BCR38DRAFT_414090 [Pseudomassariella vexata]ORY57246.1 hypothetical protein BCR38DRAFT_414090 [Pseudomassariella vexata]
MAFTAVRCPMDKEKSAYWPDNEEGPDVANDNFFDQFISFDGSEPAAFNSEFLEDLPSPSILLDSLDDRLMNSSSHDQDILPGQPCAEGAARDIPKSTSAQQTDRVPTLLGPSDSIIGGSISDSELLSLEGISLCSPRKIATAPSSPPLMPLSSLSPRKPSPFVESAYSTCRRAVFRPRGTRSNGSTALMDAFKRSSRPNRTETRDNSGPHLYAADRLEVRAEPVDSNGLPLSPPLTGKIPNSAPGQPSSTMRFVRGHLDDPFTRDGMLCPPHQAHGQSTPLDTPILNGDAFGQNSMHTIDPNDTSLRRPKQRSTSSAEWPMEGILTDDSPFWTVGSYVPDSGNLHSPGQWWEDTTHNTTNGHATPTQNGMHNTQQQQDNLPYEYVTELSGLMIHMPQPRQPQAAVLSTTMTDGISSIPSTPHSSSHPHQPNPQAHHQMHPSNSQHHRHTDRRPHPRAPSSGARHYGSSLTSPRKPSLHHSSSRPMLFHREESVSPTPTSSRRRSLSMSVRKQRSWSRREQPRTPGVGPSSGNTISFGSSGGGGISLAGGGGGVDFVNFTPSDKNLLMTGVAPSGSSKTKARREKEAMERRRRLSEAALKAVRAAGGDVDKLVEQGFVL